MPLRFFGRKREERETPGFVLDGKARKLRVDERYIYVLQDESITWLDKRGGEEVRRIEGRYRDFFVMNGYVFGVYPAKVEGFMQETENIRMFKVDGEETLTLEAPSPKIGGYEAVYNLSSLYFDGKRIIGMFTFDFRKDNLGRGVGHIAIIIWNRNGEIVNHLADESCPDSNLACDGNRIYALSKVSYGLFKGLYVYDAESLEKLGRYDKYKPGRILVNDGILIYDSKTIKLVDKDSLEVEREIKPEMGFGGKINEVSSCDSFYTITYYGKRHKEVDVYTHGLERFKTFKSNSTVLSSACDGRHVYGGLNGKIAVWEI